MIFGMQTDLKKPTHCYAVGSAVASHTDELRVVGSIQRWVQL